MEKRTLIKDGLYMKKESILMLCLLLLALVPFSGILQAQHVDIDEVVAIHGASGIVDFLREMPAWDPSLIEARARMIRMLGRSENKGNEEVRDQLLIAMQDNVIRFASRNNKIAEFWKIRAEAALSLGRIGETSAVKDIARLALYDSDTQVQICAVRALGMLKSADAVPTLIDLLLLTDSGRLAVEVCKSLGAIGDKRAFPSLLAATMSYLDAGAQKAAVEAIKQLKW
jgi:hypothetical protein